MKMPNKTETRPLLVEAVERMQAHQTQAIEERHLHLAHLVSVDKAAALVLLALADVEWAREEAESQALLAADLANSADREGA